MVDGGERPLAWADVGRDVGADGGGEGGRDVGAADAVVATGAQWVGTSLALYLGRPPGAARPPSEVGDGTVRLAWAEIERADWDADTQQLHVVARRSGGAGVTAGAARLLGADRLLQLVRERVTSALVHQRSVPLSTGGSATVSARRTAGASGPLTWSVDLPPGADRDDPDTAREVAAALAAARSDIGVRPGDD